MAWGRTLLLLLPLAGLSHTGARPRGTHGSTFTTLASDLGLTPRLALRIHMPFNTCGASRRASRCGSTCPSTRAAAAKPASERAILRMWLVGGGDVARRRGSDGPPSARTPHAISSLTQVRPARDPPRRARQRHVPPHRLSLRGPGRHQRRRAPQVFGVWSTARSSTTLWAGGWVVGPIAAPFDDRAALLPPVSWGRPPRRLSSDLHADVYRET